jgi:hypothetical protein
MKQNQGFPWRDLAELQRVRLPEMRPRDDEIRAEARDALAQVWEGLQEVKAAVTMLEEVVAPLLHELIPTFPGWAETPAGIVKQTTKGGSTRWDHEDVLVDVVGTAVARNLPEPPTPWAGHPDAARIPPPQLDGAALASEAISLAAGLSYWRVKELKALGLDPEDYRSKVAARPWVTRV